jgi:amino acid adenylation domain-containing protein
MLAIEVINMDNPTTPKPELSPAAKRAKLAELLQQQASPASFPLSPGQQALWFLYKLAPESWAYNVLFSARICSPVDVLALQQAFQALIDRHPSLRTIYTTQDGSPVQQIQASAQVHFVETDATGWSDDRLHDRLTAAARTPFDLETGPVLRVHLFTRSTTDRVLLLVAHHIAIDLWSLTILLDELRTIYAAQIAGVSASLPTLDVRYADYVRWHQQQPMAAASDYWRQQLAGELPTLDLPTDRSRPSVQTFAGASQTFELSPALTQQLKALARSEEATLYTILLAAFQVLLHRYTHQPEILVGTPTAGRNKREFAGIVGDLINSVVMRADLAGNPTFTAFLAQVRGTVIAALEHQDYPFSHLVEQIHPAQGASHSPLFQAFFIFQKLQRFEELSDFILPIASAVQIDFGGLKLAPYPLPHQEGQFDLTLETIETSGTLKGMFKYNPDLFDAPTITRTIDCFQTLLTDIVANPARRISELTLLAPAARDRLLVEWNQTQTEYPSNKCIHQLFAEQVMRTPVQIAVVFEGRSLTYQELDYRANRVAHYLQSVGVKPEVSVGICVDRSLDFVVGLLGILKAGSAYIPIDPAYPAERLAFMLQDSRISTLLTQQHLLSHLPVYPAQVICLDRDWDAIAAHPQTLPASNVNPDNLIYTIYTSGSTGKPKGVQIIHRNVVNFLVGMQQHLQLTDRDSLLSVTSISFDILGLEIFLPLTLGAKVILASREVASDGFQLLAQLEDFQPTFMQATPATWRMLIAAGWTGNSQLKVLCGGEALPQNLADRLGDRNAEVWNLYGPTETTIWSTIDRVRAGASRITIGRPIANTQVYILDEYLQPVPVGVRGELHIGGAGVARGYFDRAQLTTERFIPNPFSKEPHSRLYKTGDLARYLSDGSIEYLSRIDNQVKIRGFRIELGEIETVLRKHPAIQQNVVNACIDDTGENRLVAYIVPHSEQTVSSEELRRFVQQELPDYMVPSVFVFLDTLPLTPNGKIDRRALPAPDATRLDAVKTYVSPRDELELQLAKIWERTLGIHPIGINDNFFELGGNSLLSVKLIVQIKQAFDRHLSVVTLFQAQTIDRLATVLREERWAAGWNSLVPLQSGGAKPPLFLIHPCSGEVPLYRVLAGHLGQDRPIYGLQAVGLDGHQPPHDRVEQMVAHYLKEIQTIQPQGPYFLGGKHIGSGIALDLGRQLISQGHQVELVVIFGGFAPPPPPRFSRKWIERQVKKISTLGFGYIVKRIREISYGQGIGSNINNFGSSSSSVNPEIQRQVMLSIAEAGKNYVIQGYPGRVAIFQTVEDYNGECPDLELDRQYRIDCSERFSGGFELHYVPGTDTPDFTAYKEPHVRVLAEKLRTCLDSISVEKY